MNKMITLNKEQKAYLIKIMRMYEGLDMRETYSYLRVNDILLDGKYYIADGDMLNFTIKNVYKTYKKK